MNIVESIEYYIRLNNIINSSNMFIDTKVFELIVMKIWFLDTCLMHIRNSILSDSIL